MKKLVMFILLALGLACAGAGYYIFYLKPQQDAANAVEEVIEEPQVEVVEEEVIPPKPPVTTFYVSPEKLGIREAPDYKAFVDSALYRGDRIIVLEQSDGWGRISPYYVYEDGGAEIAEWIPMEALLEQPPIVTQEERYETLTSFIGKSDNFKEHRDIFLKVTDELLKDDTCKPYDFEELGGWVRSLRYKDEPVYFVYCGGLKQANKIYLNVLSGKTFYQ